MELSEKLKNLRDEKGLTKKAAAEQAGVSLAAYSSYEDGRRLPRRENYAKLALLYGCDVEYLTDNDKEFPPDEKAKAKKKSAARSPRKKTVKKTDSDPAKRTVDSDSQSTSDINAELQFAGKTISISAILDKASMIAGGKHIDLYIKPEENTVYYVVESENGSFEIV